MPEQREHDALEAETDAGRVSERSARVANLERAAERVLMVVARGARRRLLDRRDWHDQLELERLLSLARREHPPATPEERVVGHDRVGGKLERAQHLLRASNPQIAMRSAPLGVAHAHVLALPEHAHARGIVGGLLPEADAQHIEEPPGWRERLAAQ